jgi:hypothetical protein
LLHFKRDILLQSMIEKQKREGEVLRKYLSSLQRILNESFGCQGFENDPYGMKKLFEDYAQQISLSTLELTLYDADYVGINIPLRPLYCLFWIFVTFIMSLPDALNLLIYLSLVPVAVIALMEHFKVITSRYTLFMLSLYSGFLVTLFFCFLTGGIYSPGLEGLLLIPLLGSKMLLLDTFVSFFSIFVFTFLYIYDFLPPTLLTRGNQNVLSFFILILSGMVS